jgi:hypothetical protein
MTESERSAMQTALTFFDVADSHIGMKVAMKGHGIHEQAELAAERLRNALQADTARKLAAMAQEENDAHAGHSTPLDQCQDDARQSLSDAYDA